MSQQIALLLIGFLVIAAGGGVFFYLRFLSAPKGFVGKGLTGGSSFLRGRTGPGHRPGETVAAPPRVGAAAGTFTSGGVEYNAQGEEIKRQITPAGSGLTLRRKIRYSQLPITPAMFLAFKFSLALFFLSIAMIKLNILMQIMFFFGGLATADAVLWYFINRRFRAFDGDYAPFLLSLVSLLKTGMNPVQALDAASKGLAEDSLVRSEVEIMMERLRYGVSEDRSIGAFGEGINHPEIELFVQALLLSRRVGGTLSDTLERLAKQVRRRQYFRGSAKAAVSLQRGSIWFIVGIMAFLQVYLSFVYPPAVKALMTGLGFELLQGAIFMIALGMFWVGQVTKIKT